MMKTHVLHIGERIYDNHDDRWGEVILIKGKDNDTVLTNEDTETVVLYRPDDSFGESETFAGDCFPYYGGGRYKGMDVCEEIYSSEGFDAGYYCPETGENINKKDLD